MKKLSFVFVLLVALIVTSCNSKNKSAEVASYSYEGKDVEMSAEFREKVPEWVEKGTVCYGLVVQLNEKKQPVKGKAIKAKVVQIGANSIKMRALETVTLAEVEGCTKMGITKGETWDETESDFYKTKADAIKVLKAQNLYKSSDIATVD